MCSEQWRSCCSASSERGSGSCRPCDSEKLQESLVVERTKTVPLIPERGRIFDADGRILADNEYVYAVAVDWAAMRDKRERTELFRRLSGWIDVPVGEMERRYNSNVVQPAAPDAGQGGHQGRADRRRPA